MELNVIYFAIKLTIFYRTLHTIEIQADKIIVVTYWDKNDEIIEVRIKHNSHINL